MSDLDKFMTRDVRMAKPEMTLREACLKMRDYKSSYLVIEEGGRPVGIITEADIVRRAIPGNLDLATTPVRNLMSSPVATMEAGGTVEEANQIMKTRGFRHMVIMHDNKVAGMLTPLGLLRYFEQRSQQ